MFFILLVERCRFLVVSARRGSKSFRHSCGVTKLTMVHILLKWTHSNCERVLSCDAAVQLLSVAVGTSALLFSGTVS